MKSKILIAAMAIALCILGAQLFMEKHNSSDKDSNTISADSIVYENIMTRASVRSYSDKTVEEEKIEKLLRAGMAAPSAVDKRPWHFVVVQDKDMLKQIAEKTPNAGMAAEAPLAIIVCGDSEYFLEGEARDFWVQDLSAATENILLAAHAMGLGAVWTGLWPSQERSALIRELIEAPEEIIPFCTIVIGYPKGDTTPKDKYDELNVSYELYGE